MINRKPIPGINTQAQTKFAVLKPFNTTAAGAADDLLFSRWLASTPLWVWMLMIALIAVWPISGYAARLFRHCSDGYRLLLQADSSLILSFRFLRC